MFKLEFYVKSGALDCNLEDIELDSSKIIAGKLKARFLY